MDKHFVDSITQRQKEQIEENKKEVSDKILDYLERAEDFISNKWSWSVGTYSRPEPENIIEIAKMIQIEENK